jgi:hypothetical protein
MGVTTQGLKQNLIDAWSIVHSKYPTTYLLSAFRDSFIKGTKRKSQHSFGLAIDITTPEAANGSPSNPPPMGELDQAAKFLAERIGSPGFTKGVVTTPMGQVIWRSTVGGNHYNHVHFSLKSGKTISGPVESAKGATRINPLDYDYASTGTNPLLLVLLLGIAAWFIYERF